MSFILGWPIFRCYVSFREGTPKMGRVKIPVLDHFQGTVNFKMKVGRLGDLSRHHMIQTLRFFLTGG